MKWLETEAIEYTLRVPSEENADANLHPSPMLALNVLSASERRYKKSRQLIDVVGMLNPVAKWVNPRGLTSRGPR
ncbi:hypothetical protein N8993_14110 [Pseudomonadales bacterium]|nr:hypothetical protein [Pseudomonadales bacterium]MDG1303794.1 hypothetical protein [Pseudomonadales bacterium]